MTIKVICLGVAWLTHEGSYALLRTQRSGGPAMYVPFGGPLQANAKGQRDLRSLSARNLDEESNLIFEIDDQELPKVVDWFKRRSGRTYSTKRHLYRQLRFALTLEQISSLAEKRRSFASFYEGRTVYLIEVYYITTPAGQPEGKDIRSTLMRYSMRPNSPIYFATSTEIQQGKTRSGVPIATSASALLVARR